MPRTELIVTRPKPTLLDRVRSYFVGPLSVKSPEIARLIGNYGPTASGVSMSEEKALTASPIWSGTMMIADDIASLPLHLYKRVGKAGKERYTDHATYELVHSAPNPEMDAVVFRRTMQIHAVIWQNAYAEIERDGAGRPVALWPLVPESVTPIRDGFGNLRYRVVNPSGSAVIVPAADMIHLVGYSHDGVVGASLVQFARESIALLLAAEKFGSTFFGNGASMGGVITAKDIKTETGAKSLQEKLEARHLGVERAHKLLLLTGDTSYTATGVEPDSAQFLETRVFQIREAARWLRMPPHKLGDLADATYSNVEQMDAAYLSSCLRPWLVLWEQQLSRKLISKSERFIQFIEHDTHGFLSVDAQARGALYSNEFSVASVTPNDIRGYENRNPIDGGDDAFLQIQNIPLAMMREYWSLEFEKKRAEIAKLKEPPPAPSEPPPAAPTRSDADWDVLHRAVETLRAAVESEGQSKRSAEQRAEDLSAALTEAQATISGHEDTIAHVRELLDGAEQNIATTTQERDDAEARYQASKDCHAADALRWDGDRASWAETETALRESLTAEQERREEDQRTHDAAVLVLTQERDAATAALAEQTAIRLQEQESYRASTDAAIKERDDAIQRAAVAEATAAAAAQDVIAERDARTVAEAALTEARQAHAERLAGVAVAHRGLMVDVMRRMLDREIDRAKRHQTTPQKFTAWLDTFYATHVDALTEALVPAVRAHLSLLSTTNDPHPLARQIAEDYVAESERQLRALAYLDDFAPMLERTLQQWETSRPEAVADRLLKRGVEHVRSI